MSTVEHDEYRFCFLYVDFTFLRNKKCIEVAFLQSSAKSTQVEPMRWNGSYALREVDAFDVILFLIHYSLYVLIIISA